MLSNTLPIIEAFDKAANYLASAEAQRFGVRGVTIRTDEAGLVEFSVSGGKVVGQQVAA